MLTSGIFATVIDVEDETANVELAPGIVVRVHRGAVGQIVVDRSSSDEPMDDVPPEVGETHGDDNAGVN